MTMIAKTAAYKTRRFIDENAVEDVKIYLESDGTKGTTLQGLFLSLLAAFLVTGCVVAYSPAPLPTNHPANPAAPEAPPPPPSQVFHSESILPAPAEEAPTHGPHARHGMRHGGH